MTEKPRTQAASFRLLLRALVIFWLLCETSIVYGLRYVGMRLTGKSRAARQAMFGQTVLTLFRRLGATFIKVGQIMSTRPDLLPPHVISALASLQDNVGPFPYAAVERTFAEDFGQPISALFAEFSKAPIASASVAQVHFAKLCRHGQRFRSRVAGSGQHQRQARRRGAGVVTFGVRDARGVDGGEGRHVGG